MEIKDFRKTDEYKELQSKTLEQFRSGTPLFGEGGAFEPLLKDFLEAALEAEMDTHLNSSERLSGNKRNGKGKKTIKSSYGDVTISTPQDRHSNFEPKIIGKRETILADNLAPQIIGMYGKGMSLRDISAHIKEMYNTNISHNELSEITERIIPKVTAWQNRPLERVYPIVWLDAMHYKVQDRENGRVVSRAVYNILALNTEGKKELIGMHVSESEGANFWLSVLTELKARGVEDILIACIDNLTGFSEAIESSFPGVEVQSCIVHQIRNSIKYVASKNQKEFLRDLKLVYKAPTKPQAELELESLDEKWGKLYPVVLDSWKRNWSKLSTYFAYDEHIRKIIYTTNAVEGFHRQVRKITKPKGVFPNDMALQKLIYLATMDISKKWTQPVRGWALAAGQLRIRFGDRMPLDLN